MPEKIYKASKKMSVICMAIISLLILYTAYLFFISGNTSQKAFNLIIIIILFLIFLMPLISFKKTKYSLILRATGLTYKPIEKQIGIDFVPWSEMSKASISRITNHCPIIKIELLKGNFSEGLKFPRGHKFVMGNSFFLTTNAIKGNPSDICDYINKAITESK